jgi:Flagellar biosynthesis protein, FliO
MDLLQPYYGILLTIVAVLAAIIVGLLAMRMFNRRVRGRRGQRLGISEYHELDKTRRLVLVRRDDVEHLILIGGEQDLVVESGISGHQQEPIQQQYEEPQYSDPTPIRMAPRPAVFGDRRPSFRPNLSGDDGQNG